MFMKLWSIFYRKGMGKHVEWPLVTDRIDPLALLVHAYVVTLDKTMTEKLLRYLRAKSKVMIAKK